MIAHISGQLFSKSTQSVIIYTMGVGYEVFVPLSTFYNLPEPNEQVSLHIYTHVREDSICLFGFHSALEKNLFLMLNSVSGIGPRLAINVLSGMGTEELMETIAHGDSRRLHAIPGVGKKTAERIVLELKEGALKICGKDGAALTARVQDTEKSLFEDALSALANLGYSNKASRIALEKARSGVNKTASLEDLIKEALRLLA